MNKWFSGISIVVLLVVVASSVIQFHHHDDEGNIIWGVTSLLCGSHSNDDACGHKHHLPTEHGGHCCCGNHQGHSCGTGDNCTVHLGDYQIAKQTSLSLDDFPTTLFVAIFLNTVELISISDLYCDLTYNNPNPHTHNGVINVASLRAPPMS